MPTSLQGAREIIDDKWGLFAYSDSSWTAPRSQSGYVVMMGGAPISYSAICRLRARLVGGGAVRYPLTLLLQAHRTILAVFVTSRLLRLGVQKNTIHSNLTK